ncbi:DUF4183 domain-containing protein [Paenibacillus thiaminolyticus]|uniref:DUF4183 domain-containing protein n=1 Tax=Paenibacillus thiaminolyticus TaxID=49283 RepID=UPI00232B07D4|nr:DUF4183 domain-containing protein [Paenibacillus thiaminolyticus]WCF06923.1 DUF4183 domain-containing protein [Paenibacillus thiaminolyticus]
MDKLENQVIQIKAKPWDPALRIAFLAPSVIGPCSSLSPPPDSPVVFPGEPVPPPATQILQVETFQYITKADGVRSAYTNGDGLAEFQSSSILNPGTVSYFNLFINGMLQPLNAYTVTEGLLHIDGIPERGVPITLQFIRIILKPEL